MMFENESTYINPLIAEIDESISMLNYFVADLLPKSDPVTIAIGLATPLYPIVASEEQMDVLLKDKGLSTDGNPAEKAALLYQNIFTKSKQLVNKLDQKNSISNEAFAPIDEKPTSRLDVLNTVEKTARVIDQLSDIVKDPNILEFLRTIVPDDFSSQSTDEYGRLQEYIHLFKSNLIAGMIEDKSEYIFQLEGNIWKIVYNDKSTLLSHLDGFNYIKYLLQHAGESVEVENLKDISGIVIDHGRYGRVDGNQEAVNLIENKKAKKAKKAITVSKRFQIEEAFAEMEAELKELHPGSDEYYDLEENIQEYKKLMSKDYNHRGEERKLVDSAENARTSVKKAIERAYVRIEKDIPKLGAFLRRTIRTGIACQYIPPPDNPPDWRF